tara:strand:- start:2640 stop:2924 length:285 start_codon:yes stop_codon:yes gene_type:complete
MNRYDEIQAILPVVKLRMQNNDWPAGINCPEVYNLEVMHAGNKAEYDAIQALPEDLKAWARTAYLAYTHVHPLLDNVWNEEAAFEMIQSTKPGI